MLTFYGFCCTFCCRVVQVSVELRSRGKLTDKSLGFAQVDLMELEANTLDDKWIKMHPQVCVPHSPLPRNTGRIDGLDLIAALPGRRSGDQVHKVKNHAGSTYFWGVFNHIQDSSGKMGTAECGSVRLKTMLTTNTLLPKQEYTQLKALLVRNGTNVPLMLAELHRGTQLNDFAANLISLWRSEKQEVAMLDALNKSVVASEEVCRLLTPLTLAPSP